MNLHEFRQRETSRLRHSNWRHA